MPPVASTVASERYSLVTQIQFTRILLLGVAYSGVILAAHWLAYLIRYEFHPPAEERTLFWLTQEWALHLDDVMLRHVRRPVRMTGGGVSGRSLRRTHQRLRG